MGQAHSKGLEGIASQAFPLLASANLNLNHQNLSKRGYDTIYGILRENELLPKVIPKKEKSNEASEQLQTGANQKYSLTKASKDVLKLYTQAICAAEPDSEEIALAYASRSGITFELKEYQDSINDIDHALAGKYTGHKSELHTRRGRCYLALSQYSKALEDFNQAKSCLKEEGTAQKQARHSMKMVENFITQCQNKPDKPQLSSDPIKLSHPPSAYIQSASTAVDIKYSPEFGRHIVAAVDIKPGDVLSVEKPYVSTLKPVHTGNFFCDYCKIKSFSAVPCLSCTSVVFCSDDCRQSSWNNYHSIECGILPTLMSLAHSNRIEGGIEMKTFTALRILIVASKSGKEIDKLVKLSRQGCKSPEAAGFVDGKYLSGDYPAIHHLATNMESLSHYKSIEFAVYGVCLVHLLKEGTEFFKHSNAWLLSGEAVAESCSITGNLTLKNLEAADFLFKCLMMVYINSTAISDTVWSKGTFPSGETIGSAVFGFQNLFNHSCDPNITHFSFRGDTLFTVAIQPIKKGQQIFEDYGYNYNVEPIHERQTELKRHYNFTCKCVACCENWPPYPFLPERPTFKQPSARRSIMEHVNRFRGIRSRVFQGTATDSDVTSLSQFMILTQEKVQLPWRQYVDCQDTLKCYMNLKAHPELNQITRR